MDSEGVRIRPEDITVYQGSLEARAFFDDVYYTAAQNGGEIVQVWSSATPIFSLLGDYERVHFQRMAALQSHVSVKCVLTENFSFTPAP